MVLNAAVSPQARRVLRLLGNLTPLTSVTVARCLGVSTAHACNLLRQLQHAHLVERLPTSQARQRFVNQLRHEYRTTALGTLLTRDNGTARHAGHLILLSEAVDQVLREPALLHMGNALPYPATLLEPQFWPRSA